MMLIIISPIPEVLGMGERNNRLRAAVTGNLKMLK
jgi:hypothetical protein